MITVLSAEDMRASDAACIAAGTPGIERMARAGKAIFDAVWGENGALSKCVAGADRGLERAGSPAAVVCGTGNNAGDGYVLALELKKHGIPCRIFLLREKLSADGGYYFEKCKAAGIPWEICGPETDFSGCAVIADCIFGTGFKDRPEGLAAEIIRKINAAGSEAGTEGSGRSGHTPAFVVSADINSGLNSDTGMGDIFVRSDLTVSIGCFKPGHFLNMAKDAMAQKLNADIGIPPKGHPMQLLEAEDVRKAFRNRPNYSNKGDYGYVALIGGAQEEDGSVLIGGSLPYSGAIRLAAIGNAAMRSGAGVASIAAPGSICPVIAASILEPTLIPLDDENGGLKFNKDQFDAICRRYRLTAFGMGIGSSPETQKAVEYLIDNYTGTLILDADGLNALARLNPERIAASPSRKILTPHLKEFSRLSGLEIAEIQEDPVYHAKALAEKLRSIVLLKGPCTVITDGETVYLTDRGCPGMATAGSGDVLSGILAAVCYRKEPVKAAYNTSETAAQGSNGLLFSAASAAWINGAAGELAQSRRSAVTMTASDTAKCAAEVIESLIN